MKIYWYEGRKNICGDKIKTLRKSQDLTQKQLAEQLQLLGYDFNDLTILRIENGSRFVADYELRAFCEFFHISCDELFH